MRIKRKVFSLVCWLHLHLLHQPSRARSLFFCCCLPSSKLFLGWDNSTTRKLYRRVAKTGYRQQWLCVAASFHTPYTHLSPKLPLPNWGKYKLSTARLVSILILPLLLYPRQYSLHLDIVHIKWKKKKKTLMVVVAFGVQRRYETVSFRWGNMLRKEEGLN